MRSKCKLFFSLPPTDVMCAATFPDAKQPTNFSFRPYRFDLTMPHTLLHLHDTAIARQTVNVHWIVLLFGMYNTKTSPTFLHSLTFAHFCHSTSLMHVYSLHSFILSLWRLFVNVVNFMASTNFKRCAPSLFCRQRCQDRTREKKLSKELTLLFKV